MCMIVCKEEARKKKKMFVCLFHFKLLFFMYGELFFFQIGTRKKRRRGRRKRGEGEKDEVKQSLKKKKKKNKERLRFC